MSCNDIWHPGYHGSLTDMSASLPLSLPNVTICAVTSRAVKPTVRALRLSMQQIKFADALLITHEEPTFPLPENLRIRVTGEIDSREAYSLYVQTRLAEEIRTPFVLLVQWDGYVLDAKRWSNVFLNYDYIGASWPQFEAPFSVGNGGFSLRSKRLLDACRDPEFQPGHPEDLSICHVNRRLLERKHEIKFAPETLARRFSFERDRAKEPFGFHGVFNMLDILAAREFVQIYDELEPDLLGLRERCDLIAATFKKTPNTLSRLRKRLILDFFRDHAGNPAAWAFVSRYIWSRFCGAHRLSDGW